MYTKQKRTGSKRLPSNRSYKNHRDIAKKASHHIKKATILLKIYLKILVILEKASISLKKSSKIIEFFTKTSHFSGIVFKKPRYVKKILILI
jgi:hypothetical protein